MDQSLLQTVAAPQQPVSLLFLTKWKRNKKREEKLNTISPLLLALSEREKLPPNKYEGKVSKVRKYGWVGFSKFMVKTTNALLPVLALRYQ